MKMSTRSGKRIHNSFHENTMKSETDFTRSERKTRSKHAKDNFVGELNANPKQKKRNYVAYPADDAGVDTVDNKEEKKTRLRKNVLKEQEQNVPSLTATSEPAVDDTKPVRPTRRTRKHDENLEDATEMTSQEEAKVEVPKQKKSKKKKTEQENILEVKAVSKKKTKKKKNRRSGSLIVEDIDQEGPSALNKSNMSVDSFHSAAGSPRNSANCNELVPLTLEAVNTTSINDTNKTEARRTRSSIKLDNTLTNENVMEIEPRRRKSSVKVNLDSNKDDTLEKDIDNEDSTPNRQYRKRKSSFKDFSKHKDDKNSTDVEMLNISTRKSVRNATFDKTATPNRITLKEGETKVSLQKTKTVVNETFDVNEDSKSAEEDANLIFERDSTTESGPKGKKKKSAVGALIKEADKSLPCKDKKQKPTLNEPIKQDLEDVTHFKKISIVDDVFNSTEDTSHFSLKSSPNKLSEQNKIKLDDTTFEKDSETDTESVTDKKTIVNETFDVVSSPLKSANEASSLKTVNDLKRKSVTNLTYEKDSDTDPDVKNKSINTTFDKIITGKINTTFEKEKTDIKNKSTFLQRLSTQTITDTEINSTFDVDEEKRLNTTFDKHSESSSIVSNSSMTLEKSDDSRISITSDESNSKENILNTTPVLIESSMDDSVMNTTKTPTKEINIETAPVTPLKREGTFTKETPEVIGSPEPRVSLTKTPTKQSSLPSAGFTPFHTNKSAVKDKSVLNVTRSIEKRRSSLVEPRTTKVMFCSPVNNPALLTQNRRKVIKSNLKGSNKSFVFDESVSLQVCPSNRKRSYTQSDADDARVKRKRLAGEMQLSVDRLSRPRSSSASAKLAEPTTPKKATTPKKSEAKLPRTKLPNFAALHQKQFDKMESLDECQERKAKRAKQLLTPTGAVNMLDRISPKDKAAESEKPKEPPKKPETPIKSLPTFKSLNPGYTRFGFKLNLDVNPFSIPSKTLPKPKENKPNGLTRQATLPSLAGATSVRREVAKQTVMREKSFTDRRNVKRTENRTVIKGVRTNRRFELQMRMRDI